MNFDQLLANDHARQIFMQFLRSEYSQENLEFYLDCQRFKVIKDRRSLAKCSQAIYGLYIDANGSKAINIDAATRRAIGEALTSRPTADIFAKAEQEIVYLMSNDSFVRFRQTQTYQQLVNESNQDLETYISNSTSQNEQNKRSENSNSCVANLNERSRPYEVSKSTPINSRAVLLPSTPASARKRKMPEPITARLDENEPKRDYENYVPPPPPLLPRRKKKVRFHIDSNKVNPDAGQVMEDAMEVSIVSNVTRSSPRLASRPLPPTRRYLRLTLPDTSREYLSLSDGDQPLSRLVERVLIKRQLSYSAYKLYSAVDNWPIDPTQAACRLNIDEIRLEPTVQFVIHFPEGYLIDVETTTNKLSAAVLRVILSHFNIAWTDIELLDEYGSRVMEVDLMRPTSELDTRRLYVRYLSSLRTYLNLRDLNDLNEDGICIKSLRFEEYRPPLPAASTIMQTSAGLPSFSSFTVDNRGLYLNMTPKRMRRSKKENIYDVPSQEEDYVDLREMSFSDPVATDNFLNQVMVRPEKVRFVSTPVKVAKKKKIARVLEMEDVHRAHLVVIDTNRQQQSTSTPSFQNRLYGHDLVINQSKSGERPRRRLPLANERGIDVGLPCPTDCFSNRIPTTAYFSPNKRRESPARRYLHPSSTPISGAPDLLTSHIPSPAYLNAHAASLKTLSRFHKIG